MVLESVEDEDQGGHAFILRETAQTLNFIEADAEGQPLVPGLGIDDSRYHDQQCPLLVSEPRGGVKCCGNHIHPLDRQVHHQL
jgi:hypothetical protein